MLRVGVRYAAVTLLAAGLYFVLAPNLMGLSFVHLPRFTWVQETFGSSAGFYLWAHAAHGIALLVAALPSAVISSLAGRPRVIFIAAVAGCLTAWFGLAAPLLDNLPHVQATSIVSMVIDGIKFVLLLVLVTWLVTKLPPNYTMQRSSRVGTPLAGTSADADRLRSASDAPSARHR